MKNVACSRLGTMLHLEIQKGKEAMKKLTFQSELGGTAACMKRLAIATKGCGQLTSGRNLWSEVSKGVGKYENQTLRRDVRGTTDL